MGTHRKTKKLNLVVLKSNSTRFWLLNNVFWSPCMCSLSLDSSAIIVNLIAVCTLLCVADGHCVLEMYMLTLAVTAYTRMCTQQLCRSYSGRTRPSVGCGGH